MKTTELWESFDASRRYVAYMQSDQYSVAIQHMALCTQVYNRVDHLKKALPTWLLSPFSEIVIFDWGSDDGTYEYVSALNDPRIVCIKRLFPSQYNMSKARNTALREAFRRSGCMHAFYTDADVCFKFPMYELALSPRGYARHVSSVPSNRSNNFIISAKQFCDVGGFNERFEGWGNVITDFFDRVKKVGAYCESELPFTFQPIEHSDEVRCKNFAEKDPKVSCVRNQQSAHDKPWTSEDNQETFRVHLRRCGQMDVEKRTV